MNRIIACIIFIFIGANSLLGADANELINRINNRFAKDPNAFIIASIDRNFFNPQKHLSEPKKIKSIPLALPSLDTLKSNPLPSTYIPYPSDEAIAPIVGEIATRYGVDQKIIRALIANESNFEPLTFNLNAIGTSALTLLAQLKEQYPELRIKTYERWGKQFASLYLHHTAENIEKAKAIFEALRINGINFDSSYMQINSQHYARLGISNLNAFDPNTNIEAGAKIYKDCETRYGGDFLKSVECYNKGSFRGQTSYYDKVFKTYQTLASATLNPSLAIISPVNN